MDCLIVVLVISICGRSGHGDVLRADNKIAENDPEAEMFSKAKGKTVHVGLSFLIDVNFQGYKENTFGYLAAFTKAVDMRFQPFKNPAVKISYAKARELTTQEADEIKVQTKSFLDGEKTLSNLVKYIANTTQSFTLGNKRLYWKDVCENCVAFFITNTDIVEGGGIKMAECVFAGMSYYGGACSVNRAAIGQDDGKTFSGVDAAAQQVGRLLGLTYDGHPPLGNKCPEADGCIMNKYSPGINHSRFSNCSGAILRFVYGFAMNDRWDCLNRMVGETTSATLSRHPYDFFTNDKHDRNYCKVVTKEKMMKRCKTNAKSCKISCCGKRNFITEVNAPDGMGCERDAKKGMMPVVSRSQPPRQVKPSSGLLGSPSQDFSSWLRMYLHMLLTRDELKNEE